MGNIVNVAGVVLVVVAAAAGTLGYFRANVSKSTIALYKEDNAALRARVETLEAQGNADRIEVAALKSAQQHLVAIVTQAEQIAGIREVVDQIGVVVDKIADRMGIA